ncbi:hypothetical protein HYN56_14660 [Flavobacterium crocinum]|uniref:Uncharacterized protein n=1 Tax=Flavobacterium crocinum TaxID=2183896 RepID=A0A2S1YMU9_9FLAO|nr:hypothetical protein HYN56_14660 [Flavobacterium crocinum]
MELTITFINFILALFFVLLSLIHLNDGYNRYSISKIIFLPKVLFFKLLFFVDPARRIYEKQQSCLC